MNLIAELIRAKFPLTARGSNMSFLKRSEKKRGAHRPSSRLSVDTLEDRCVPAVFLQAGTLEINGTAGNDYAVVTEFGFGTNTTIRVLLNGTQSDFLKANL